MLNLRFGAKRIMYFTFYLKRNVLLVDRGHKSGSKYTLFNRSYNLYN